MVVIGGLNLLNQVFGHGFTGLVVLGKRVEELFFAQEVLIKLRGQFDKVTRHSRTGLRRVVTTGKHAM